MSLPLMRKQNLTGCAFYTCLLTRLTPRVAIASLLPSVTSLMYVLALILDGPYCCVTHITCLLEPVSTNLKSRRVLHTGVLYWRPRF